MDVLLEHNLKIGQVLDINIDQIGIKCLLGVWETVQPEYLSVGFISKKEFFSNNCRQIIDFDIREISLVQFPAQKGTLCKKRIL